MANQQPTDNRTNRVQVIAHVEHPLAFFVLALLIIEAVCLGTLPFVPSEQRLIVICIMAVIFLLISGYVAFASYTRPNVLTNAQVIRRMDDLKVDLARAEQELKTIQEVLGSQGFNDAVQEIVRKELQHPTASLQLPPSTDA